MGTIPIGGAVHKEYGDTLENDDTIVAHIIHSWLQLRDRQQLLIVKEGMGVSDLHKANYEWLQGMIDKFEEKRNYRVKPVAVTEGIYWYLWGYKKKK